ncbi:uncharacterized protein [Prorops nasuta]|uniref:uncharacterized protein n=1 Tax=Prorops nasuta TaxID=863751 RepID=UPI0034CFECF1
MNTAAVQEERGPRNRNKASSTSRTWNRTWESRHTFEKFDSSGSSLAWKIQSLNLNRPFTKSFYELGDHHRSLVPLIFGQTPKLFVTGGGSVQYEISAEIFLDVIRGARRHRDFSKLELEEQNAILRRAWSAIFLLRAATLPIDLATFQTSSETFACLANARNALSNLRPNLVELSTIETFLLCRPEISRSAKGSRLLSNARNAAAEDLARHVQGEKGQRLLDLLFLLPILTECCPRELVADLFAPIIGDANLDRVIASIK